MHTVTCIGWQFNTSDTMFSLDCEFDDKLAQFLKWRSGKEMHHLFRYLHLCFSYCDKSKCLLWKRQSRALALAYINGIWYIINGSGYTCVWQIKMPIVRKFLDLLLIQWSYRVVHRQWMDTASCRSYAETPLGYTALSAMLSLFRLLWLWKLPSFMTSSKHSWHFIILT